MQRSEDNFSDCQSCVQVPQPAEPSLQSVTVIPVLQMGAIKAENCEVLAQGHTVSGTDRSSLQHATFVSLTPLLQAGALVETSEKALIEA